jgi:hypothetical protein
LAFTASPANNVWLVGSVLIVFGLVLLWADTPGATSPRSSGSRCATASSSDRTYGLAGRWLAAGGSLRSFSIRRG